MNLEDLLEEMKDDEMPSKNNGDDMSCQWGDSNYSKVPLQKSIIQKTIPIEEAWEGGFSPVVS